MTREPLARLGYAYGPPTTRARLRADCDDFRVIETLDFEPDDDGEHALLYVRKRDANTAWVAERLAAFAGLPARSVSYAGLKDRRAVTEQWYSVHLPGADRDWLGCDGGDRFWVLRAARHRRKLRRGSHSGNRFRIVARIAGADRAELERRLEAATGRGVPNYFGPQRFGRDGANLARAEALFAGRLRLQRGRDASRRGLILSAARAELFNRLLDKRVVSQNWDRLLDGDALMLDGSRSWFVANDDDDRDELSRRLAEFDLHPSGPLWGRGELPSRDRAATLERGLLDHPELAALAAGLERAGLEQQRRALRLRPQTLSYRFDGAADSATLTLEFWLPAGAFATAVLRELVVADGES